MASSSSSTNSTGRKYDVFLNFRGTDTRNNFTSHLHLALCDKGIDTFIDDQLERGKVISPALLEAIGNSRMSILVFSQDYASSTYCLDELVKILECRESKGQTVIPIFYNVNPEEVEKQTGRYGESFTRHESMEDLEKVKVWKAALSTAASLSGRHLNNGSEADLIRCIVEELHNKLDKKLLHVAECPVGLESHMEVMNRMLSFGSVDVRVVGIWGTGGIGKTTIAKVTFNRFAKEFEGSCFLANVRERSKKYGVSQLQETLLSEILGDKKDLRGNSDLGISVLKDRLSGRKVFVVIDDVDHIDQLKKLAGDWLGPGSIIIITTRDKHLLISHRVQMYEVKRLRDEDALQLFSWNAFKKTQPEENYAKLSHSVLKYADGLPLALVVMGCDLYGRSVPEWQSYLNKLKRIPNKQICEILKISFDGLEENDKDIFLDIACFFKGERESYVREILEACDFEPVSGIPILIEKSLINIEGSILQMHDLIQSMGCKVIDQESTNPGKRSRLWRHEDVLHVLIGKMGTHKIKAIMLDLPEKEEVYLPAEPFTSMTMLRMLIVRNAQITGGPGALPSELRVLDWNGCPAESLPFTSVARNKLVMLKMPNSLIKHLGFGLKNFRYLKSMDFRHCKFLTEISDLSTIPCLETLDFSKCASLVKVHPSIGFLEKLETLRFDGCFNLKSLPSCFELRSLRFFTVNDCIKLENLPNFKDLRNFKFMDCNDCTSLREIPDLSAAPSLETLLFGYCTSLVEIHPSIGLLEKLGCLSLHGCSSLKSLPGCIKLTSLKSFSVNACSTLEDLPHGMEHMTCLTELTMNWTSVKEIPNGIENMTRLSKLHLSCTAVKELPSSIVCLPELETLEMAHCKNLTSLPSCISKFTKLVGLYLDECPRLREIPDLPKSIEKVKASGCESLERFSQLKHIFRFNNTEERLDEAEFLDFSNCHKLAESQGKNFENPPSYLHNRSARTFNVFLPGSEILPWFDYKSEGDSLSFPLLSIYRKLKARFRIIVAVAVEKAPHNVSVAGENESHYSVSCGVFINGRRVEGHGVPFYSRFFESDNMWLCSMLCTELFYNVGWFSLWLNDCDLSGASFEIKCSATNTTVKRCGVHLVFEQECTYLDPLGIQGLEDVDDEGWECHGDTQRMRMGLTDENGSFADENELLAVSPALPLQPTVQMTTHDPSGIEELEDKQAEMEVGHHNGTESDGCSQTRALKITDQLHHIWQLLRTTIFRKFARSGICCIFDDE